MNTIQINDRTIQIPSTWNDLTPEQQSACYAIIMTDTGKLLEPSEILPAKKMALLQYLLQLPANYFQQREIDYYNDAYQDMPDSLEEEKMGQYMVECFSDAKTTVLSEINELFSIISFLFERQETDDGEPEQYAINLSLTKCPIPFLEFQARKGKNRSRRTVRWYAPADGLDNMTLYELAHTFTRIEAYLRTKDEKHIIELLAMIYRPSKPKNDHNLASNYEGDRRQPYRKFETTVAGRKRRIEELPESVKQILVFWFTSCRQQIVKRYPNIFKSATEGEQGGNNYGYAALLLNLADGIVHLDAVSDQNFHNAFTHLSYLEDQRKLAELRRA